MGIEAGVAVVPQHQHLLGWHLHGPEAVVHRFGGPVGLHGLAVAPEPALTHLHLVPRPGHDPFDQEVAKADASHSTILSVNNSLYNYGLMKFGTEAQKQEFLVPIASGEKIAADQYGHMKRQTANLERLSNEIAVAIGERIEKAMMRMPAMMGEAMEPVTERLDSVAGQIGQTSTEGMASMVSQLSEELKGAGQDSMQQVVLF